MAVATAVEKSKAEQFVERTIQIMNDAGAGADDEHRASHRFVRHDGQVAAVDVGAIAEAASLNPRYVKEWLGAMVTGGIVEHDAATDTFLLPAEHAACLTRASSPNNIAVAAQWVSVLGTAEDAVVDAFQHGRGVPYSAYPRFHAVMAEESRQTVVEGLLNHILPLSYGLIDRLGAGIDVLDIACGSAGAILSMAETFPLSRFTGVDMSAKRLLPGASEVAARDLRNVTLVQADAAELWLEDTYHLITAFDAIHDQARPARVLERMHAALRPGGVFLMQDIAGHTQLADNTKHPLGPFTYTISCMHCMSVSLASGGPGLGAMWGREKALEMLTAAGFVNVRVTELPHDPINYYYVAVKEA